MDDNQEVKQPEEKKVVPSQAVKQDIATQLANSGPTVRSIVISKLATEEIDKRTVSTIKVLDKVETKTNELRKLRNQGNVVFGLDGQPIGAPTFTKPQLEEMKKSQEFIDRHQNALEKAFSTSDFSKVHELANQG